MRLRQQETEWGVCLGLLECVWGGGGGGGRGGVQASSERSNEMRDRQRHGMAGLVFRPLVVNYTIYGSDTFMAQSISFLSRHLCVPLKRERERERMLVCKQRALSL